ncbi:MAG TPA: hypothetical protein VE863_23175 [Pyrinomonadaceae bacterium]|jgi:hypothetical protein|nr:hypothetical protein [Pyrinomonadaceae bacterium]
MMKPYRSLILSLCFFVFTVNSASAQNPTKARTETGKDVLLFPDGTWKYADAEPPPPVKVGSLARPTSAKAKVQTTRGDFAVWYDESKWQLENRLNDDDILHFRLRRADGYAMVLAEGLPMPMATLKAIAVKNAKDAAPDAHLVSEDTRTVNGTEVMLLTIDGTVSGIPFRYFGYYYSGKQGTIQFIAFTGQNLFDKNKADFADLLNGLEIIK